MNRNELRQTTFDVVPLKNVVGVGNSTAYQICVTRGKVHATMGKLDMLANEAAANDDHSTQNVRQFQSRSVLSRVFSC